MQKEWLTMNHEKWLKEMNTKKIDRRSFLGMTGKTAAVATIGLTIPSMHQADAYEEQTFSDFPFTLGVASGDPLPDSVVLWTRLAPNPLAEDGRGGMIQKNFTVHWEMAEDEGFTKIVRSGTEVSTPELGHSVHAEVFGLKSNKEYYYRFKAGNEVSPVGRTKTAPDSSDHVKSLSFAIASCQSWTGGRYAAYQNMINEDIDFVLHLGDYVYEKRETETLADFRINHALYKTSPDLQAAHAKFPFIVTFDDHEIENNWANDISQNDGEESNERERFLALRAAAFQAFYEHLPLRRRSKPNGSDMLLYRKFTFGDLAEFSVMDTRQYRDDQPSDGFPGAPLQPEASNPSRTLVGSEQGYWILKNLEQSRSRWNVLAQQTIMAQFDYDTGTGISVNHDQWDGYSADRDRIFTYIKKSRPSNPVVLSGDWHSSWVNDLKEDFNNPKSETLATEFVGTSISSGCGWKEQVEAALSVNPHVKFFNGDYRGYVRCHVTHNSWKSDYIVVSSPSNPEAVASTLASFAVQNGKPGAIQIGGINVSRATANTMFAGKPSAVSIPVSNGANKPVKVTVNIPVPEGWKSESVSKVLEPSENATFEVMITPPASIPAAEILKIEVNADKTAVYGLLENVQVVSVPYGEGLPLALDAGDDTSPVLPSFTKLSPKNTWDVANGYGWVGQVPSSRDRKKPDPLQRDFTLSRNEPTILRLAVPEGVHKVYVLTGDASYGAGNTIIRSDNKLLAESGNELSPGQFKWIHFELDGGTSGKETDLEITGALLDGWWRIGALVMIKQ
jgi:alkaline phosphatase D